MTGIFRDRMGALHTWAGVVFSVLLFAIFWTGSLSVFDKEIDRWMMPATRLQWDASAPQPSLDRDVKPLLEARAPKSPAWTVILPTERTPFLTLTYGSEQARKHHRDWFDPRTMAELPKTDTAGASGFLYPFHHNLTIRYKDIGAWIVGLASVAMLCLLVSGVVIHRKLFAEFFTLRLRRGFGRANLDVHNVSGILLLPFYILITLSGLIVAFSIYFPSAHEALYAQQATPEDRPAGQGERRGGRQAESPERAFLREALGRERLTPARRPSDVASLEQIVADAERHWGKGSVYLIRVNNPEDAGGNVVLRRSSSETVTKDIDHLRYSSASGEPIGSFQSSTTVSVWNFIAGTHYLQFRHWLLRWLYFLGGIGGCAMIATGLFFWTQARRRKHLKQGHVGVTLVDVLSVGGICGIIAGTFAFFLANKLLPDQEMAWGIDRSQGEILAFYMVWLMSLIHALLRSIGNRQSGHLLAWREQCWAIAALAAGAALSNWLVTGDHLLRMLGEPYWPVVGMDLSLLLAAALSTLAASKLARRERSVAVSRGEDEAGDLLDDEEPARG